MGSDDFDEMLLQGGTLLKEGYAQFSPDALLANSAVSEHVKALLR